MSAVALQVENRKWRGHQGLAPRIREAADRARKAVELDGGFTILLTGDAAMRRLNRDFRGKDQPTNVLSFPSQDHRSATAYRGDIALGYETVAREASAQGKAFADHVLHLIVHGVLHLAGYDHQHARDARRMEPLETAILSRLGIADPYAAQRP